MWALLLENSLLWIPESVVTIEAISTTKWFGRTAEEALAMVNKSEMLMKLVAGKFTSHQFR